jgi:hypothetical protein
VLCCGLAFAQQQPQWTVISAVKVVNQTAPIAPVTLFTPTQTLGLYRVSAYIAETGTPRSDWSLVFQWTDSTGISGAEAGVMVSNPLEPRAFAVLNPTIFSPKPGTPVTYEVDFVQGSEIPYTLMFTIEQLKLPGTK